MRTNERPASAGLGRGAQTPSHVLALARCPRSWGMRGCSRQLSPLCQGALASGQCLPAPPAACVLQGAGHHPKRIPIPNPILLPLSKAFWELMLPKPGPALPAPLPHSQEGPGCQLDLLSLQLSSEQLQSCQCPLGTPGHADCPLCAPPSCTVGPKSTRCPQDPCVALPSVPVTQRISECTQSLAEHIPEPRSTSRVLRTGREGQDGQDKLGATRCAPKNLSEAVGEDHRTRVAPWKAPERLIQVERQSGRTG